MSYFLLPNVNYNIESINITYNSENKPAISKSLNNYLNNSKQQIDDNYNNWDYIKKYTNPYEFIHTNHSRTAKHSVSKLKPLSRSFYKMIEITKSAGLISSILKNIKYKYISFSRRSRWIY